MLCREQIPTDSTFGMLEVLQAEVAAPLPILTTQQRAEIWTEAVNSYQAVLMNGKSPGATVEEVATELLRRFPQISATREAAMRQLYRKVNRIETDGKIADLRSQANRKRQKGELSPEDRVAFNQALIYRHYGDIDKAWRDCLVNKKFSQELRTQNPIDETRRTRCPKWVRRQYTRRLIKRMLDLAHRPRKARQNGPYIHNLHSHGAGNVFSIDDVTLEIYFKPPAGDPCPLRRGQFFPLVDCRSKKILAIGLVNADGYRQDEPLIVVKRGFKHYGIAREIVHVENGVWEKGKLLGGRTYDSESEIKRNFAERLGIRLINSMPAAPRGKIVENILKLLQMRIRGNANWVGPDEKKLTFEHSKGAIQDVLSGRKTAEEAGFWLFNEWFAFLRDVIVPEYNATKQMSLVMGGTKEVYMSPNEAWEAFQPRDSNGETIGMDRLSEELEWLFDHREIVNVGRNGIHLPYCGGLNYKGGDSGKFLGQDIIVYFDPEKTERVHISDLKQECWGIVPQDAQIPRWTASREQLADAFGRIKEHDSRARMLVAEIKSAYKAPPRRIIADAAALEIGRGMQEREAALRSTRENTRRTINSDNRQLSNSRRELNEFLNP